MPLSYKIFLITSPILSIIVILPIVVFKPNKPI